MKLEENQCIREGDYMKINIHAGHNPDGKVGCGAVGLIKESTEARKVTFEVINILRKLGHTAYDCTVDNGTSQNDVLSKIVAKCNKHDVDLDVSIHFNSGRDDKTGDGSNSGTEVYIYSENSKAKTAAERVCKSIAKLGFRNRGVKVSTSLYVLKHTNSPAMLIECCFVDDKDDTKLYNYKTMAKAIAEGILGAEIKSTSTTTSTSTSTTASKNTTSSSYKVKITATVLNIRNGAGVSNVIVGQVKKDEVYTIVETKNGWGKLKSGVGWILLKYTKEV